MKDAFKLGDTRFFRFRVELIICVRNKMENIASSKTWELSLYELHRTPLEPITDKTEIAVSPRSLHSELMCPICLDMLKNTMTTKECLHRFCQECIITALRSGNKECPTCRKKLISKRSLRPDPNFDALIAKIYPNREEYDAHQEKLLEKLKQQRFNEGKAQLAHRKIKKARQEANVAEGNENETEDVDMKPSVQNVDSKEDSADEIEIIFKIHPEDSSLLHDEPRFVRTTANATSKCSNNLSIL